MMGYLKSSVLSNIVNVKKTNIKSFKNIFSQIKENLLKGKSDDLTVRYSLSSQVYDGRFMNNFWLREVPDAVSKISWENVALVSLQTAKDYSLNNSDLVKLSTNVNGNKINYRCPCMDSSRIAK